MNVKKGSKNAIENRGKTIISLCKICGIAKKPVRVISPAYTIMAYQCTCGVLDKKGNKIV